MFKFYRNQVTTQIRKKTSEYEEKLSLTRGSKGLFDHLKKHKEIKIQPKELLIDGQVNYSEKFVQNSLICISTQYSIHQHYCQLYQKWNHIKPHNLKQWTI